MRYIIFVYKSGSADVYDKDGNMINCLSSSLEAEQWVLEIMEDGDDYNFIYDFLEKRKVR